MQVLGDTLKALKLPTGAIPVPTTGSGVMVSKMITPLLPQLQKLARAQRQGERVTDTSLQALLKQDFGSQLVINRKYSPDWKTMMSLSVTILGEIPQKWLEALEYITEPATGEQTAQEVTRLRTLTAKRAEGEFDLELSIGALTEELTVYPYDVVKNICREWARMNKWFPTLHDLIELCEEEMRFRRAVLDGLQRAMIGQKQIEKVA